MMNNNTMQRQMMDKRAMMSQRSSGMRDPQMIASEPEQPFQKLTTTTTQPEPEHERQGDITSDNVLKMRMLNKHLGY